MHHLLFLHKKGTGATLGFETINFTPLIIIQKELEAIFNRL